VPADLLIRKSDNTGVLVCNLSFVRCFSVSVNNHREATRATTVYMLQRAWHQVALALQTSVKMQGLQLYYDVIHNGERGLTLTLEPGLATWRFIWVTLASMRFEITNEKCFWDGLVTMHVIFCSRVQARRKESHQDLVAWTLLKFKWLFLRPSERHFECVFANWTVVNWLVLIAFAKRVLNDVKAKKQHFYRYRNAWRVQTSAF